MHTISYVFQNVISLIPSLHPGVAPAGTTRLTRRSPVLTRQELQRAILDMVD